MIEFILRFIVFLDLVFYLVGMSCCWFGGGSGGGVGGDKYKGDFRFIVRSSTPFIDDFGINKFILRVDCWFVEFTSCCNDNK